MSLDPFKDFTNSGNPVLAALGAGSAAASSIVRSGQRGECGLCETVEAVVSQMFRPGAPGREQVRIVIVGDPFFRHWVTIHLRQQGYCGIHSIEAPDNERYPASSSCETHRCREVWITSDAPRITVATTTYSPIPEPGMWVLLHSPCCLSWSSDWRKLDGNNGLEFEFEFGEQAFSATTPADSGEGVKASQCRHDDGPWNFITNGPGWEIEMKRVGEDVSLTPDEANNNYSGPAGNVLLNTGKAGWYRLGSLRHGHSIWVLLLGQMLVTLAVAWYSVAGPLVCCMAGRRAVASYINGSNNRGIGLVTLDDDGLLLVNSQGNTSMICFRQRGISGMKGKVLLCALAGLIELLGSWMLMLSKAYLIAKDSARPSVERKLLTTAFCITSIVLAVGSHFRKIPGKQNNVGGAPVVIGMVLALSAAAGTVMWFKYLDPMHMRCIVEVFVLLGWLVIKWALWIQQYVKGGAIDPVDYSNLEGSLLLLSGAASLLSLKDPYSV